MHNTQVQEFAQAVERRIPIIVVDPRFSVAASKAKYWLPIKAGDRPRAAACVVPTCWLREGRYDRDVRREARSRLRQVRRRDQGLHARMGRAGNRPRCRLDPRHGPRVRQCRDRRALVHPGRRVTWNGDDTQRSRAIALLSALLGNWGRKGGLYFAAGMNVAPYPLPKPPKSDKPMADNPNGDKYPFADEGITNGIREATLTGKPYPIKGWFVYSTNILYALPNPAETLKAIDALDLLVVVDTHALRDHRLRRRRAARGHVPRALRAAAGRVRAPGLDIAAPAGDAAAARTEARTGGSRRSLQRSSASPNACRSRTSRNTCATASRSPG